MLDPYLERDEHILKLFTSGATRAAIAIKLGLDRRIVRDVINRGMASREKADRVVYRAAFLAQLDRLRSMIDEIAELPPPPAFSTRGDILRDERENVVRDYSARLRAAQVITQLIDRQVKLLGLDAPIKFEGTVRDETDAALQELVAELDRRAAPIQQPTATGQDS